MKIGTLTEEELYELPTSECNCSECLAMCKVSRPCWGTPKEFRKIIDHGYGDKLMLDWHSQDDLYIEILSPAIIGYECKKAPFWPKGRCTMLENDLCIIHSIKPIEGRYSDHTEQPEHMDVHYSIVDTWNTEEGKKLVEEWKDKFY